MTMHEGHRSRMRKRFLNEGLAEFSEHEVLELLLFYSRPRGDTNALAHQLVDAFGSMRGVMEASADQLMTVKGVGEETATLLTMIPALVRYYAARVEAGRVRFDTRQDCAAHCTALLAGERTEKLYALCLSANNELLGQRLLAEGSLSEVMAYPRLVVETALNYNAYGVVLCHNHPGGSATPSAADIMSTRQLRDVLRGVNIELLDHLIVSGGEAYSMALHDDQHRACAGLTLPGARGRARARSVRIGETEGNAGKDGIE